MDEGGRPQIGSALGEEARDQRQLVVLDQHRGPGRGCVGRHRCELLVDLPEAFPSGPPVAVEAGASGQVPQTVQAKPQGLVGHHAVVGAVVGRVDHHRSDPEAGAASVEEAPLGRFRVVRPDGGRDPQGRVALRPGPQGDHQAATPSPGGERPVRPPAHAERAPIGQDQQFTLASHSAVTLPTAA